MPQTFCHVCYGTSLTFENGVLVCDACGTQTQIYQEETEFQQGIDDARGRRRAAGSLTASQQQSQAALIAQQEVKASQQLKDAAFTYVRCLQHLLRTQGAVLSSRFGVSQQIVSLLRQMWLSYLPLTGIIEPEPHKSLGRLSSNTAPGSSSAQAAAAAAGNAADEDVLMQASDEEGQSQQGNQSGLQGLAALPAAQLMMPHVLKKLLWQLLHPQVTLQLCFLGCLLLRESVTFYDIMSWALDGQLPFLELPRLCSELLSGDELLRLPVRCIQPQLMLEPLAFCSAAARLAAAVGLDLPPIAAEGLLMRAIKELALPQMVYDVALQLHVLYLINTPQLKVTPITRAAQVQPYAWLGALLLITFKILYGLGGAGGQLPVVAKAPGPPGGWLDWSHHVMQRLPGITSLPLTEEEVVGLEPAALRQYIQFCRQYMFAGHPVVSTMDDVQRLLAGWYDASAALDKAVNPLSAGTVAHSGNGVTGAKATFSAASCGGEDHHQSGIVQRGTLAGAEHFSNYNLTLLGLSGAKATTRLQPQLAAVVIVIAAYSHVSPSGLLDCVRMVEKQMVAVESAVKVMNRLNVDGARHTGVLGQ